MKKAAAIFSKILVVASFLFLYLAFFYLFKKIEGVSELLGVVQDQNGFLANIGLNNKTEPQEQVSLYRDECGSVCKEEIKRLVSEATATFSATRVITTTQASPRTDFISLGSTHSTKSTDWATIDDSAVFIDLINDYGKNAKVSWEAALKVAYGNGKAFVRLYDDTNKIAVDYSELVSENNAENKQVSSGNLPFWKGRNLYKVQIKSLNSVEVTFSSGKLKVSY